MTLKQHSDTIWEIEDFFSAEKCEELMIFSEMKGYEEASVSLPSGAKMMKSVRNNYRLLYEDAEFANFCWQKLKTFCPQTIQDSQAIGLNELFRFYKYEPQQRFKKHKDGSFQRNAEERSFITFLVYLNDDFEGGETRFENLEIRPKTGAALCFFHEERHEGAAVISGSKYVLRSDVMYKKFI